jgi:type IV secretion system protein VirD4
MFARIQPGTYKFMLFLLTIVLTVYFGWSVWTSTVSLAKTASRSGWPKVIGLPASSTPASPVTFTIACLKHDSCRTELATTLIKRLNPYLTASTGIALLLLPFWWVLLTPRNRMLYNSRWASLGQLGRDSFELGDKRIGQTLQLAHSWAYYPPLNKTRHGYTKLPAWGEKAGPKGGKVITVATKKNKRELAHVLVVGPTRSGKGLMITQNLLTWAGNVIINDPKGENHSLTAAWREKNGQRIRVIDPSGNGDCFDPIKGMQRSPEALKAAADLIMKVSEEKEKVFAERASMAVLAVFHAAMHQDLASLPYLHEVTNSSLIGFVERLREVENPEVQRLLQAFLGQKPKSFTGVDEDKFLNSAWATLTTKLGTLLSSGVLRASSSSDVEARDFLFEPTTLYLRFSEVDLPFTKTYLELVWLSLTSSLIVAADARGGTLPIKTLLLLDEAKAVPMPRLADFSSTIAGRGLTLMVFVQDLSQLEAAYTPVDALTIMANCKTHVYFKTPEQKTRKMISERCGKLMVADKQVTTSSQGASRSFRSLQRELITPDEVERLHDENVIVFMDNQYPILGRRLNYLEHPLWSEAQSLPILNVQIPSATVENPTHRTPPLDDASTVDGLEDAPVHGEPEGADVELTEAAPEAGSEENVFAESRSKKSRQKKPRVTLQNQRNF